MEKIEETIFVPDELIIFHYYNSWNYTYKFPNGRIKDIQLLVHLHKLTSKEITDLENGNIPPRLEKSIRIVKNNPISLSIRDTTLIDESKKLPISLDYYSTVSTLRELGIYNDKTIDDCVISFVYGRYTGLTLDFPFRLRFINTKKKEVIDFGRNIYTLSKDYYSKSNLEDNLIPGHIYLMKGYEYCRDEKVYPKRDCLIYIGKLKFANGQHLPDPSGIVPITPGSSYKSQHVFVNYEDFRVTTSDEQIPIKAIQLDTIIADITSLFPSFGYPLPGKAYINEITERFEASMWSWKFWNTPGYVDHFFTFDINSPYLVLDGNDTWRFQPKGIRYYEMDDNNPKKLPVTKFKFGYFTGKYGYDPSTINNTYYSAVILDSTDSSKPLQVSYNPDYENFFSRIIKSSKKDFYSGELSKGIGYVTSDKKYKFLEVFHFCAVQKASLWRTGDSKYYTRTYYIAQKIYETKIISLSKISTSRGNSSSRNTL